MTMPKIASRAKATRAKMSASHLKTWANRMNFSIVPTEFWDADMGLSSRNRGSMFITFRDFKKLFDAGKSIDDMLSLGISKHLLYFFSKLAQGKFAGISKASFVTAYLNGDSLDKIAKNLTISREDVTFLRAMFQCKVKGAKYIHRKATEIPLTDRQKEILYGSMMGDAKKVSPSAAGFVHGSPQKNYLLWKYQEFDSVASKKSLKSTTSLDTRSGKTNTGWRFYTHANSDIEKIIDQFYPYGKKVISKEVLANLTPLSLAVWFMDDGKTDFAHRERMKGTNVQPSSFLCTDCFSKEEVELMTTWFQTTYGIECVLVQSSNGKGWRIRISKDRQKFIDLIRPHVLPMFDYKMDYASYVHGRFSGVQPLLQSKDLRSCPTGKRFAELSPSQKDQWTVCFLRYFRRKGFDWLVNGIDVDEEMSKFAAKMKTRPLDGVVKFSTDGGRLPLFFSKSFWRSRPKGLMSPVELFESDRCLAEIIWDILISDKLPTRLRVLSALRYYRGNKSVASFQPSVAWQIFHKYAPDKAKVLDFCSGFGGRMLGAMFCDKVASYVGIEVNIESCTGSRSMHAFVSSKNDITKDVSILNQDAIIGMSQFRDKTFDFCFTSPPYFDAEEYSEGPDQSSKKYPTYGKWLEEFMQPAIMEAVRVSNLVAINISNTGGYPIADDIRTYLISKNMLIREDFITFPAIGGRKKIESIFLIGNGLLPEHGPPGSAMSGSI